MIMNLEQIKESNFKIDQKFSCSEKKSRICQKIDLCWIQGGQLYFEQVIWSNFDPETEAS